MTSPRDLITETAAEFRMPISPAELDAITARTLTSAEISSRSSSERDVRIARITMILHEMISRSSGEGLATDRVGEVFDMTFRKVYSLVRVIGHKVHPPRNFFVQYTGENRATSNYNWAVALRVVNRAVSIAANAHPDLSLRSKMLLLDALRSGEQVEVENGTSQGRPVSVQYDMSLDLLPMISKDEHVDTLCGLVSAMNIGCFLTGPAEDAMDMIRSGTPLEWTIASMLEEAKL